MPDGMIASLHGMGSARVVKEQVSMWTEATVQCVIMAVDWGPQYNAVGWWLRLRFWLEKPCVILNGLPKGSKVGMCASAKRAQEKHTQRPCVLLCGPVRRSLASKFVILTVHARNEDHTPLLCRSGWLNGHDTRLDRPFHSHVASTQAKVALQESRSGE